MRGVLIGFGVGAVLLLLGLFLYITFIPGQAVALERRVWPAEKNPHRFSEALKESGWNVDPDKDYYFVSYVTSIRSFLPFSLHLLHAKPTKDLPGIRIHAVTPDFARSIRPLEKITFTFNFLIEIPKGSLAFRCC
ncbi:MAG: hypothetical protein KM296_05265 [Brockia lithotrophica]|nr:hypothetical protein [Brockia lithotrophica]